MAREHDLWLKGLGVHFEAPVQSAQDGETLFGFTVEQKERPKDTGFKSVPAAPPARQSPNGCGSKLGAVLKRARAGDVVAQKQWEAVMGDNRLRKALDQDTPDALNLINPLCGALWQEVGGSETFKELLKTDWADEWNKTALAIGKEAGKQWDEGKKKAIDTVRGGVELAQMNGDEFKGMVTQIGQDIRDSKIVQHSQQLVAGYTLEEAVGQAKQLKAAVTDLHDKVTDKLADVINDPAGAAKSLANGASQLVGDVKNAASRALKNLWRSDPEAVREKLAVVPVEAAKQAALALTGEGALAAAGKLDKIIDGAQAVEKIEAGAEAVETAARAPRPIKAPPTLESPSPVEVPKALETAPTPNAREPLPDFEAEAKGRLKAVRERLGVRPENPCDNFGPSQRQKVVDDIYGADKTKMGKGVKSVSLKSEPIDKSAKNIGSEVQQTQASGPCGEAPKWQPAEKTIGPGDGAPARPKANQEAPKWEPAEKTIGPGEGELAEAGGSREGCSLKPAEKTIGPEMRESAPCGGKDKPRKSRWGRTRKLRPFEKTAQPKRVLEQEAAEDAARESRSSGLRREDPKERGRFGRQERMGELPYDPNVDPEIQQHIRRQQMPDPEGPLRLPKKGEPIGNTRRKWRDDFELGHEEPTYDRNGRRITPGKTASDGHGYAETMPIPKRVNAQQNVLRSKMDARYRKYLQKLRPRIERLLRNGKKAELRTLLRKLIAEGSLRPEHMPSELSELLNPAP